MLAFRSLDPFRALREPDRRRRDEERPSRSEQRTLASTLVVDFRVDPQRRAAVWLRWPSAQSAKVELQDFNLERERTDDRREISAGRAAGEGWRERFSASRGGGGIAVADGERRRGADRRRAIRAQRRADHLAQRLPRPDPGYQIGRASCRERGESASA